jgi:hypothetical protein
VINLSYKNIVLLAVIILAGCRGIDRLEYNEDMPLYPCSFFNGTYHVNLPASVVWQGKPYSNAIRTKWIGAGAVDDYPITTIGMLETTPDSLSVDNTIILQIWRDNSQYGGKNLYRSLCIPADAPFMRLVVLSNVQKIQGFDYSEDKVKKIFQEDNELFLRILETYRVKIKGDYYKVKIDKNKFIRNYEKLYSEKGEYSQMDWKIELVKTDFMPKLKDSTNPNLLSQPEKEK